MIVREWRARAGRESASLYPRHFNDAVLPMLRKLEGFVAGSLLSRIIDEHVEFLVMTRWDSLECIRGFAGPEIDKAVVEPAAAAALLSYDRTVQHYDVVDEAS
jgi:heme-degrading monooxygenase HmoA